MCLAVGCPLFQTNIKFNFIPDYLAKEMPTSAKTHLEMRQCVCIMCWRKPKNLRNITAPVRELLELHVLPADDDRWRWLPTVICLGCATDLRKLRSDPNYTINMVEYDDLVEPMPDRIKTRTETIMQCNCSMCSVGRLKVLLQLTKATTDFLYISRQGSISSTTCPCQNPQEDLVFLILLQNPLPSQSVVCASHSMAEDNIMSVPSPQKLTICNHL